jgi:membrane protein implicated in regulation of membrane protease activity
MFLPIYLFALVLGGVLLLASIFTGGEGDTDADVDADVDVDADAEIDAEAHHGGHAGVADTHGSLGGLFSTLFSLRFWTFFAAFFGLTGLVLDGADLLPGSVVPLGIALALGTGAGVVAVAIMRSLHRGSSGEIATVGDYAGRTGRVLLAFDRESLGKLRLEIGGTTVDVLAKTDEAEPFRRGDEALVVEMQDHTAFVARIGMGPTDD